MADCLIASFPLQIIHHIISCHIITVAVKSFVSLIVKSLSLTIIVVVAFRPQC